MAADASPLAQRIARLSGIDLDSVPAVDGQNRIRARDVLATLSPSPADDDAAASDVAVTSTDVAAAHGVIRLETACHARSLFDLAACLGGRPATKSFEHAVLFIVARSLCCVPGITASTGGHSAPTVRLGILAGEDHPTTLSWNTAVRRIGPLSHTVADLETSGSGAQQRNPDMDAAQIFVRFVSNPEVRDGSNPPADCRIPNLTVHHDERAGSADLVLTWNRRFADDRTAAELLSELKRAIEEPRRLLL